MCLAGRDNVIVCVVLLKHQPHCFHVLPGIAPIPLRIEVAKIKFLLQACFNASDCARDLSRDKRLAAARTFVIEEYAATGEEIVRLAIINGGPMCINLSDAIRAAWMKGCLFSLWRLVHFAKHL